MVKSVLSMSVDSFSSTDIVKNWLNIADNSNGMSNQQRSNSQYRISDIPGDAKVLKKMDGKAGELQGFRHALVTLDWTINLTFKFVRVAMSHLMNK